MVLEGEIDVDVKHEIFRILTGEKMEIAIDMGKKQSYVL